MEVKKGRILKLLNGLSFSLPALEDSIAYELFINGIYDKDLVSYLKRNIPVSGVLVDIGANVGAISVLVARSRPDVLIYAFEASPHIFDHLIKNQASNKINNMHCINKAAYYEDNFWMDFFAPKDQFGKGSFSPTYTGESEKVETIRLDSFLINNKVFPDIIKIDVQGYEIYVFEGLRKYLEGPHKKPVIIFEFEYWAESIALGEEKIGSARKLIAELGYNVFEFDQVNQRETNFKRKIDLRKLIAFPRSLR